jgi:hypothetical protein
MHVLAAPLRSHAKSRLRERAPKKQTLKNALDKIKIHAHANRSIRNEALGRTRLTRTEEAVALSNYALSVNLSRLAAIAWSTNLTHAPGLERIHLNRDTNQLAKRYRPQQANTRRIIAC